MNTSIPVTHFNVFTVEEFDAPTKQDANRKAKSWSEEQEPAPARDTRARRQSRHLPSGRATCRRVAY